MDKVTECNGGAPRIIELDAHDPIACRAIWACCVIGALIILLLAQDAAVLTLDAGLEGMIYSGYPDGIVAWPAPALPSAPLVA